MDDPQIVIEQVIAGEVWWIGAALNNLLPAGKVLAPGGNEWEAYAFAYDDPYDDTLLWHVTARGNSTSTTIHVTAPPEQEQEWRDRLDIVRTIANEAQQGRQRAGKAPGDQAIEYYYRSRAAGSKITLQQVAGEFNLSPNYLRKRKVEYDRLGMWGSKGRAKGKRSK